MQRTYDIFEKMSDGSVMWRVSVAGHDAAIRKLKEMAAVSPNEFELRRLPTHSVIVTINTPKPD